MRFLELDIEAWKSFAIGEFFTVTRGKRIVRGRDYFSTSSDEYCYSVITSKTQNNGVDGYYHSYNCPGNTIVCGGEANGMFTTYQPDKCWVMDRARIFTPKKNTVINKFTGLFLATIFNQNQYKYSYGRTPNPKGIEKTVIKLPVNHHGSPDWLCMEQYIKSLKHKPVSTKIIASRVPLLAANQWGEYKLGELFKFCKGKRLTKEDMLEGEVNFIGAVSENNGVRQLITASENSLFQPNCITVNYNGSVGEAFYQNKPFWASDDVNVLYAKNWELNPHIAMFLITIIKANRYKFNYGRKWTLDKMKESFIKLPKSSNGLPYWLYMENYIKSLPYSDNIPLKEVHHGK